jgi:hypothetical protein
MGSESDLVSEWRGIRNSPLRVALHVLTFVGTIVACFLAQPDMVIASAVSLGMAQGAATVVLVLNRKYVGRRYIGGRKRLPIVVGVFVVMSCLIWAAWWFLVNAR